MKSADFKMRLMHWNILADKLTDQRMLPEVDPKYLSWPYRCKLVQKHISEINPDILGLSELDCLLNESEVFSEEVNRRAKEAHKDVVGFLENKMNYKGLIAEKANGKSASAIFYKTERYEPITAKEIVLSKGEKHELNVALTHLRDKHLGCELVFAEVHLKATQG